MDILKNAVPKSCQGGMRRHSFDCAAEGQAKFIRFYKNLESLDPPKQAQKGGNATTSATGTNHQILKKEKRPRG
eukprot:10275736-Ditylum_brightwellii.AAC.1